ncbi:putative E3 ubiquitin-protein ligase UNKL [Tubulanus polymorphus]|uniref:putative E3 ubiquitin-protein ligase UNKL n=1 Tax=Tubulanus polymorphus TaxID=672921 RepID=UPI003DA512DA
MYKMPVCEIAAIPPTQTEKPHHYTYLKEFRTQQCPLFTQHKCTQHRPYTCFHWHFLNQRRRRPIRRRDGTFNYSPDIYCTKYDETTGICPDGDECPYLHRTAGDTERRYHLRYYKTGTCVHETDARGHCVKNGPHCAFAHGALDLRPPAYDVREIQAMDVMPLDKCAEGITMPLSMSLPPIGMQAESPQMSSGHLGTPNSIEKDRILNEDPKWNDTNYVLANYKTEPCKRPPRLCRQGYACPSYHNSRDKRRSPKKFKYRSTPCPNVKHGDDWGDPNQCENGDNCPYCHSRTEQQFHPEIYKSTKCNDMVQTGYCPRGPFCAFAHVEQEMTTERDITVNSDNSLAAFVTNALPPSTSNNNHSASNKNGIDSNTSSGMKPVTTNGNGFPSGYQHSHSWQPQSSFNQNNSIGLNQPGSIIPEPIGKGRSSSIGSSMVSDNSNYAKAPGSEREDTIKIRQQILAIDNDPTLDVAEKNKRKQNLFMLYSNSSGSTPNTPSIMSPHAPSFYPPADTVESVIGNALDDLTIDDFDLSSIDKELERDNDSNSVSSSYSAGYPSSGSCIGATSVPVNIPGKIQRGSLGSLSQSPPSPLSNLAPTFIPQHLQQQQKQEQQIEQSFGSGPKSWGMHRPSPQAAAAFLSQPNPGKYAMPSMNDLYASVSNTTVSPRTQSSSSQSPLMMNSGSPFGNNPSSEIQRLRDELASNKAKLVSWEDGINQARSACEAWKKEAEDSHKKAKLAEEDRLQLIRQREEALSQVAKMKQELELLSSNPYIRFLLRGNELDILPISQLKQLQQQLRLDTDRTEKALYQYSNMKCIVCRDRNRTVGLVPCNHCVLCESCAGVRTDCPYCHSRILQRQTIPMS